MNHKELVDSMSAKLNLTKTETDKLLENVVSVFAEQLAEGNTIALQGFGNFEVRKKEERISVHPVTRARTLTPPKLAVNFKQSSILKEKLKQLPYEQN
jgi:DNA-binding protein HU-beta